MTELIEQIKYVAELRREAQETKGMVDAARMKWEQDNATILSLFETNKTILTEAETRLREMTIEAYNETGNKQPAEGVGIRVQQTLDYDIKEAYDWAVSHNMATILDVKNFEKIAKASPLEFVTYGEKLNATISTDLSNYLET